MFSWLKIVEGVILYRKHPEDSTRKLQQLINTFSNVAGRKINVQKLLAFL